MSIVDPPKPAQNGTNGISRAVNGRGELVSDASHDAYEDTSESGSQKGTVSLAIDLSSPEDLDLVPGGRGRRRKRHVFSQFSTYRGPKTPESTNKNEADPMASGSYTRQRPKVHK